MRYALPMFRGERERESLKIVPFVISYGHFPDTFGAFSTIIHTSYHKFQIYKFEVPRGQNYEGVSCASELIRKSIFLAGLTLSSGWRADALFPAKIHPHP